MTSVQDWKTAKCAKTEDSDHITAVEALASLLEGNITPADAAQSIATAYTASLKATKRVSGPNRRYDTKLPAFWASYMSNAIECFGSDEVHARLTSLLVEISKLPDLKDDDGVVVKTNRHQTFWSDLPGWGFRFAKTGLSKLLQKGSFAFALPLEASCCLRFDLEYSYEKEAESGTGADESTLLIRAAATWLLFAGEAIYEHCFGDDTSNGWDSGRWNLERWELWKRPLAIFAERGDLSEDCRELAEQTVKKVVEVEERHQG